MSAQKNGTIQEYLILAFIGGGATLLCQYIILLAINMNDLRGTAIAGYALVYPIVFCSTGAVLAHRRQGKAFVRALALCAGPIFYWCIVAARDYGGFPRRLSAYDSSAMFLLMPMTLVLTALTMLLVSRRNQGNVSQQNITQPPQ